MNKTVRIRLISYLVAAAALLGLAVLAPGAWASPEHVRPGQTIPTPTPRGLPSPGGSQPSTVQPQATAAPSALPTVSAAVVPTPTVSTAARPSGLAFTMETNRNQIWPGATVHYTLTLTNADTASVRQIVITDTLPTELEPGQILAGVGSWNGQILRVEAAILPPGGRLEVTYTAIVRADVAPGHAVLSQATASTAGGMLLTASSQAALPPAELPVTGSELPYPLSRPGNADSEP